MPCSFRQLSYNYQIVPYTYAFCYSFKYKKRINCLHGANFHLAYVLKLLLFSFSTCMFFNMKDLNVRACAQSNFIFGSVF